MPIPLGVVDREEKATVPSGSLLNILGFVCISPVKDTGCRIASLRLPW